MRWMRPTRFCSRCGVSSKRPEVNGEILMPPRDRDVDISKGSNEALGRVTKSLGARHEPRLRLMPTRQFAVRWPSWATPS